MGKLNTARSQDQNLLVLLQQAQNKFGCVPEEFINEVAHALNISVGEVYGVATFYSFLSPQPRGKNVIRVCKSLPCYLKHNQVIIDTIIGELGVKPGGATPDGKFSFELINCIGACDKAPAMLVNSDLHGNLTPDKISRILKSYR